MKRLNGMDLRPPDKPSKTLLALLQVFQWAVPTIKVAAKSLVIAAALYWGLFVLRLVISGIDPLCR